MTDPSSTLVYCWAARLEYRIQIFNSDSGHSQKEEEQALFKEALQTTTDLAKKYINQDEDLLQAKFSIVWALFWQRNYAAVLEQTKHEIPNLTKSVLSKGVKSPWTYVASVKTDYAKCEQRGSSSFITG